MHPPPLSAGGGGGGGGLSLKPNSQKGGWIGLEGVAGNEGGNFFQVGVAIFA